MKTTRLGLLGIAILSAMAAAPVQAQEPKRGGTLVFAVGGEPNTYDCHASSTFAVLQPVAPHYSTLLRIDGAEYPAIKPDIASSWDISADGLTYTLKIRTGVKFHDGSTLSSADVKATYDRLIWPPKGVVSLRQASFDDVTAVEAPDPETIIFRLGKPNASMLGNLASPWNCIYSASKLAGDPRWPDKNIMGTGPFVFDKHTAGSTWTGRRFEDYWNKGKPYLDGFRIEFTSGTAMINGLQGGRLDAEFRGISPAERDRLKAAMGDKVVIEEAPWVCRFDLFFNTTKKPFDDVRVRRAFSMAIDRWKGAEALSRIATVRAVGGTLRPGYDLATPEAELVKLPGFAKDSTGAKEQAKKLLKEAGMDGMKLQLLNRNQPMPYGPVSVYLIDEFRKIGINTDHPQVEVGALKASLDSGNYDSVLEGICEYMDDPNLQLLRFLSKDVSPLNMAGYIDRELDELYEKQKRSTNVEDRKRYIQAFDKRLMEQAYVVPVVWWHRIVARSKDLKGWYMTPSHFIGQNLETAWLDR